MGRGFEPCEETPMDLAERAKSKRTLAQSLERLTRIGALLRWVGLLTFTFTCTNLVSVVLPLSPLPNLFELSSRTFSLLVLCSSALALISVVVYESLRKQGDSLFEEVSDELQWNIRKAGRKTTAGADYEATVADERPKLHTRIILRSFARATDLPLIPGKFGPAIYAGVNTLMLFIYFLSPRFR